MAVQTAISQYFISGIAGDALNTPGLRTFPAINGSSTDIGYGLGVASDTTVGSNGIEPLVSTNTDIVGINVRLKGAGPYLANGVVAGADGLAPLAMGSVVTSGQVIVAPEETVVVTDSVFVRVGPGGTSARDTIGSFRKDADALPAAAGNTAYALGARVAADTAKVYECITAGTSGTGPATPPTGTSQDITDGTVHWKYVGACVASSLASAVVVTGAKWRQGSADMSSLRSSGVAIVEINKP